MKRTRNTRANCATASPRHARRGAISLASRRRSLSGAPVTAAAFHWYTRFFYEHNRAPQEIRESNAADMAALLDIVRVQCHSDEDRALDLIEAIIGADVAGDSLSARYVAFWRAQDPGTSRATVLGAIARNRGVA